MQTQVNGLEVDTGFSGWMHLDIPGTRGGEPMAPTVFPQSQTANKSLSDLAVAQTNGGGGNQSLRVAWGWAILWWSERYEAFSGTAVSLRLQG